MKNTTTHPNTRRHHFAVAVCAFALLVFAAPSSFAQASDIHQLSYNNSFWSDQDLNSTSNPLTLDAFTTSPTNQSHVYYVARTSPEHIHQQFNNGVSWDDEDLTAETGAPSPSPQALAGFSVGNFQYVYYVAIETTHIHQLLYNNVGWKDTDITAESNSQTTPSFTTNIIAFTTSPALHVYYVDVNNDIWQLFSPDGTSWQNENLTNFNDPDQTIQPALTAGFNIGNLQYLYWIDQNAGETYQLSYNNSTWSNTDLTKVIKTPIFLIDAAFVIPGTKKIRLYSSNSINGHILQLSSPNNGKWSVIDLTKKSKGPVSPDGVGSMLAFTTSPNNEIHLFYAYESQIYQIYQNTPTTWASENITQQGNGAILSTLSPLVGFAVGNLQYVFYETQ
jgi:hypothetical protein